MIVVARIFKKPAPAKTALSIPSDLQITASVADAKKSGQPLTVEANAFVDITSVQEKINSKNYTDAITASKAIYNNDQLTTGMRIQAVTECILAATAAKDATKVTACTNDGNAIIAALPADTPELEKNYYSLQMKEALGTATDADRAPYTGDH